MNLKQLNKQLGTNLRLRPIPRRIDGTGVRLADSDDSWRLEKILDKPSSIQLLNIHTGHVLKLQPDNVKEYRSPDFLLLRCQLVIRPQAIEIEPVYDSNDVFVRVENQMSALLAEMREDLKTHPLSREVVLLKRSWTYWAKGNELVYYFDKHPDLLSQFQILANHGLVTDITHNNTPRYLFSEELAQYLGG